LHLAGRVHGTHQSGNAVDDPTETFFAGAERLLEALPVVNIRMQGIPADTKSFCVPQRQAAYMGPAVYAISAADTVLRVIWLPGFD
jgi:hypothetical protein